MSLKRLTVVQTEDNRIIAEQRKRIISVTQQLDTALRQIAALQWQLDNKTHPDAV